MNLTEKLFDLLLQSQREAIAAFMKDCKVSYDASANTMRLYCWSDTLYMILATQADYFVIPSALEGLWIEIESPAHHMTLATPLDCQRNS